MISAPTSTSTRTENWNTSRKKNWIRYMWSRWKLHGNVGINTSSKEVFRPKNLWNWLAPSFSVLFCFCVGSRLMGKKWSLLVSSFLFPCFLFSDGIMTATVLMCLFWSDHPPNAEYFSGKTDYCYAVLIRFSGILSISTPSPLPPPPSPLLLQSLPSNLLLLIGDSSKKRPY